MSSKGSGLPRDEIFQAIHNGNLDLIKSFITSSEHANIKDRSGHTLLYVATNQEKVDIAKWLVSIGSDINLHCNGHTVTSLALTKGNFDLFQFYLDNNGDCKGKNQLNLLHEAANKNRVDIVETLINKGADPNQLNSLHFTPLTIAVNQKNTEICQLLLENGACANLPDKKGNTPLHMACQLADCDLINVLLDNTECDLRLKNSTEETPFDLYWTNSLHKEIEMPLDLLDKLISAGALFSTPFNFIFNQRNLLIYLNSMSHLCKYNRLVELFVNEKPLFTDLIISSYMRNALIVAIKSAVIDFKQQTKYSESDLYNLFETIILTKQFNLNQNDLCSTFYMFDDVAEQQLAKQLKALMSQPLKLKDFARAQIRRNLLSLNEETINKLDMLTDHLKNYLLFKTSKEVDSTTTKSDESKAVLIRSNSNNSNSRTSSCSSSSYNNKNDLVAKQKKINPINEDSNDDDLDLKSQITSSPNRSPFKKLKR